MSTRSASTSTEARAFDGVGDALEADPAARVAAHRPAVQAEVEISCTDDGYSTGIIAAENWWSDWCGSVDDFAAWSSPASTSTPPCFDVPAKLACLNTSPQRSTPGPLPYHIANTPSTFAARYRLTCCVPQTAVAARSSFTPGLELDVRAIEELLRLPQRLVEAAERRAAIAGDEAGGVEPRLRVALALQHQAGARAPGRRSGRRGREPSSYLSSSETSRRATSAAGVIVMLREWIVFWTRVRPDGQSGSARAWRRLVASTARARMIRLKAAARPMTKRTVSAVFGPYMRPDVAFEKDGSLPCRII